MPEPTRYDAILRVQGVTADDCRAAAEAQLRALGPIDDDGCWVLEQIEFAPLLRVGEDILQFEAVGYAIWVHDV